MLQKITAILVGIIMGFGYIAMAQPPAHGTDDTSRFDIFSTAVSGNNIVAGTTNNRIFVSSDSGKSWKQVFHSRAGRYFYVSKVVASGSNVFARSEGDLLLSADHGMTWKKTRVSPREQSVSGFEQFKGKLYASTLHGLYVSADDGNTWQLNTSVDTGRIDDLTANSDFLFVQVSTTDNHDRYVCYSSRDGVKWTVVSKAFYELGSVESNGNIISAKNCYSTLNENGLSLCQGMSLSLLSEDGKKIEEVEQKARYFTFDKEKIYALNIEIEIKKNKKTHDDEYIYKREILMSDDRGENWTAVNDTLDSFVTRDNEMQHKLAEMDGWKAYEMEGVKAVHEGLAANRAIHYQHMAELRGHGGTIEAFHSVQSSGPNYRQLSNDRFKEANNHRDSWIDSRGKMHIN